VLGKRLIKLTRLVLGHRDSPIDDIMGWSLDSKKFKSSMTLFSLVAEPDSVFHQALEHFFDGKRCKVTLRKMGAPTDGDEGEDDASKIFGGQSLSQPGSQDEKEPTLKGASGSSQPARAKAFAFHRNHDSGNNEPLPHLTPGKRIVGVVQNEAPTRPGRRFLSSGDSDNISDSAQRVKKSESVS
jgi:hypothetical protein